jgi:hypothetical protein
MADLEIGTSPSTGKTFVRLPGNRVEEITPEQADVIRSNPGAAENFVNSIAGAGKQILLGGASLVLPEADAGLARQALAPVNQEMAARGMQSPVSTTVGSAVPYLAADVAAMAIGGIPAAIAAGALTGASGTPDAPLMGAAVGAAGGVVPAAAQVGMRGASRMGDRVVGRITQATDEVAPEGRYLQGYLSPDEMKQYGFPATQGDQRALMAGTQKDFRAAESARNVEELRRSDPLFGAQTNAIRDEQRMATSNFIKQRLGISNDVALTDDVMAESFKRMGAQFDDFANRVGSVPVKDATATLREIAEQSTGSHGPQLNKIVADIEKLSPNGNLSGQDWQAIRTRLSNMIDAGMRQGDFPKVSDANEAMRVLQGTLEGSLPQHERDAIRQLRSEYRLASSLSSPNARSKSGEVNIRTVLSNWKRGQSKKSAGTDEIGRVLNTAAYLTERTTPTSGTAERLRATAPGAALRMGAQAAGIGGIGGLLGLF